MHTEHITYKFSKKPFGVLLALSFSGLRLIKIWYLIQCKHVDVSCITKSERTLKFKTYVPIYMQPEVFTMGMVLMPVLHCSHFLLVVSIAITTTYIICIPGDIQVVDFELKKVTVYDSLQQPLLTKYKVERYRFKQVILRAVW